MSKRVYLGDGLYTEHDGYQYWLISNNGLSDLNKVALEPSVLESFLKYVETVSNVKITVEKIEEKGDKI